jgi:hypothetical protein
MMTDAAPPLPQGKRYLTIRQTAQAYPAMTESALRWLRFNGDANGFNRCVLAVGRKLLIDAEAFERWLEAHRDGGASA